VSVFVFPRVFVRPILLARRRFERPDATHFASLEPVDRTLRRPTSTDSRDAIARDARSIARRRRLTPVSTTTVNVGRERVDDDDGPDGRVCVYPYTYHRSRPATKIFLSHDLHVYPPPSGPDRDSTNRDRSMTPSGASSTRGTDGTTSATWPHRRARACVRATRAAETRDPSRDLSCG